MRRIVTLAAVVALGAFALAGCGSESGAGPYVEPKGPPVKTFEISAENFSFTPDQLRAPAGILQFDLTSDRGIHDLVIEGVPGFIVEVGSGDTASRKVKLEPGTYTFYCSLPGHRTQGMEGTLIVE